MGNNIVFPRYPFTYSFIKSINSIEKVIKSRKGTPNRDKLLIIEETQSLASKRKRMEDQFMDCATCIAISRA